MSTLALKAYEIFKSKFGEKEAEIVIEYFESKTESKYQEKKDVLATKEDIAALRIEIAQSKSEIIKWMFIFWVGQIATVIAIMKLL